MQERACHEAVHLTSNGEATPNPHEPGIVIRWPGCPLRWYRLRQLGPDVTTLAGILEWRVERGDHRAPYLGAGAARLYREYLKVRELPEGLRAAWRRKHPEGEA